MMTKRTTYSPDQFNKLFELAMSEVVTNQHTGINTPKITGQQKFIHFFVKKRTVDQQYQLRGTDLEDTQVWVIRHNAMVDECQYVISADVNYRIVSNSPDESDQYERYDFITVKKLKGSVING